MTKEQIYDDQIYPLVKQIVAICKEHKINTHAIFFLDDDMIYNEGVDLSFITQRAALRCVEIAMETCRYLNTQATSEVRSGRPEEASRTEMKADQCEWVANQIRREFGLKDTGEGNMRGTNES